MTRRLLPVCEDPARSATRVTIDPEMRQERCSPDLRLYKIHILGFWGLVVPSIDRHHGHEGVLREEYKSRAVAGVTTSMKT